MPNQADMLTCQWTWIKSYCSSLFSNPCAFYPPLSPLLTLCSQGEWITPLKYGEKNYFFQHLLRFYVWISLTCLKSAWLQGYFLWHRGKTYPWFWQQRSFNKAPAIKWNHCLHKCVLSSQKDGVSENLLVVIPAHWGSDLVVPDFRTT